jgi:hypothetical protein
VDGMLEEPAQINSSEIDSLKLELEQVREDLNFKKDEMECMEKGKKSSDSMYKREIDILSSGRLKLIDENRSLRNQLALKKNTSSQEMSLVLVTVPVITSSLMSPMVSYSILVLLLIAVIWFVARKWWNS